MQDTRVESCKDLLCIEIELKAKITKYGESYLDH